MARRIDDGDELIATLSAAAAPAHLPEDDGLALVARDGGFGDRYRVWRGRSGKRYIVTVMPLSEAVRVEGGVILLVALDEDGERRVVWGGESGAPLPGLVLAPNARIEAHVHLLATGRSRPNAVADLVNGEESYSSVLTVSEAASQESVGSTTPRRSSARAVFTT